MFMGNGEQYIWKPPEEEEMLMHQNKALGPLGAHTVENIQPSAAVVAEMYSKVCKPGKKKRAVPGSPPGNPGFRTLDVGPAGGEGRGAGRPLLRVHRHGGVRPGLREPGRGLEEREAAQHLRHPETAEEEVPAAFAAAAAATPPPTQQQPPPHLQQAKALLLPGENLYESIGDLKQGSNTSSTTTIFTFNDGMEMYVTGL
ncbi:Fc receptor-like A [Dissostichus eleginoides]|uniref:Fc receptor-like A n=1 Tax=Dissostichus eleginoides TaxID=100907 RepID=A0AAD9FAQ7_DISEL|nr:Fc receptor-like A [Dissostichus eleginoides]